MNLLVQAASPQGHLTLVHRSYFVFPAGLFVGTSSDTRTNVGREGSAQCSEKGVLLASQGFTWEPTGKDHSPHWSELSGGPWHGKSPHVDSPDGSWPCLHHFNSSPASLLPTWGLAGFGMLQPGLWGYPTFPPGPIPIPPLPTGDGFISLPEQTASLQLGFHKCI